MIDRSRLLYLLPELFVGSAPSPVPRFIRARHVSLELSCPEMDVGQRDGKIRLGRPLPNKGYVVGHDRKNRMGWFVPFSSGLQHLDIAFIWNIHVPEAQYRFRVEHLIHVETLGGQEGADDGQIWSMDVMPWYRREGFDHEEPLVNVQPSSRLTLDEIHPARKVELVSASSDGIAYEECLRIPPVSRREFVSRWIGVGCGIFPVIS
jgi:hypothetical protein